MAKTTLYTVVIETVGDGDNARFSRTESSATSVDGAVHGQVLASGNTLLTAPPGVTRGIWIFPSSSSTVAKYANTINSTTGIGASANWTSQMMFLPVLANASVSINANASETVDIMWI